MNPVLLFAIMLGVLALSDLILPDCLKMYGFPLFGTGEEYDKKFRISYNRGFPLRMIVNAVALATVFFLKLGDIYVIAAITVFALQVLFFMWRAEIYARPFSGRKWWKNES